MRLLIVGIAACLVPLNLFGSQPAYSNAPPARFAEHTIATDLKGGYQVVVSDINHDGKPDLIAVASGMKELIWFENPMAASRDRWEYFQPDQLCGLGHRRRWHSGDRTGP